MHLSRCQWQVAEQPASLQLHHRSNLHRWLAVWRHVPKVQVRSQFPLLQLYCVKWWVSCFFLLAMYPLLLIRFGIFHLTWDHCSLQSCVSMTSSDDHPLLIFEFVLLCFSFRVQQASLEHRQQIWDANNVNGMLKAVNQHLNINP